MMATIELSDQSERSLKIILINSLCDLFKAETLDDFESDLKGFQDWFCGLAELCPNLLNRSIWEAIDDFVTPSQDESDRLKALCQLAGMSIE